MSDPDRGDAWQGRYLSVTDEFAQQCAELRDSNPFDLPALKTIIVFLATELWDRGFSQSEIKVAFESAVTGLVRYGAGEDRRGNKGLG